MHGCILGNHYSDRLVNEVKAGHKLQGTGDNWDMMIRVHEMQSDHQNVDLHYFASNLIVEKVPCQNLSKKALQKDINSLPNEVFLLKEIEASKLKEDFKVLVGRILLQHIPSLAFLKSIIPQHIKHKYYNEMSRKSTIVPLPMQFKDKKRYEDIVDILDFYEQEIDDIYSKAGKIQKPNPPVKELRQSTATLPHAAGPDQPCGNFNQADDEDHMKGISVPFGGDQMTRVRFAGGKDLRSGAHTAKERFDHVCPFVSELFHTKMAYLQVINFC